MLENIFSDKYKPEQSIHSFSNKIKLSIKCLKLRIKKSGINNKTHHLNLPNSFDDERVE